ncbi:LOW QUALITY PROTEIN: caspase activity and apoptosis inhibitor 1-like [Xenia sp. Carnegie-2017]|uniref:LOW QUALITY PROTEIN: caspase activity and apoptosis inhibitor 1-like n=1 Tax=Xenia sp. Carnegie-2017 TaxID=2897299 RepID=UPI001F046D27|nr:LOW QUALITY PROTEIN: caspase activity and apoptosis inhibitor 1-like [Xenia sp. Carnegie-2017]
MSESLTLRYFCTVVAAMVTISNMADSGEERQRVSPDSSTQVLKQDKRKHRKRKKHKYKSKRRKHTHSVEKISDYKEEGSKSSSLSDDSGNSEKLDTSTLDEFTIDIKPLNEYVDDRKRLNDELFKILDRKEMKKFMSKSVKKLKMEELKARCLDVLEILSRKITTNNGRGRNGFFFNRKRNCGRNDVTTNDSCTNRENTVKVSRESVIEKNVDRTVNILEEMSVGPDQYEIDELVEGKQNVKTECQDDGVAKDILHGDEQSQQDDGDTAAQILELELRARALKSLMKAQHNVDP